MVVDLGDVRSVGQVELEWTSHPSWATVETSTDGLTYVPAGPVTGTGTISRAGIDSRTRYVALVVQGGIRPAGVRRLTVTPG